LNLSVVMPVHNAAAFLDESLGSILRQTFTEFEFVILDDASSDESWKILEGWARRDRRIRLIRSAARLGPVGSSNAVVREARGTYLARMDADDVCHPTRLERQLALLCGSGDIALVATLYNCVDAGGRPTRPRDRWRLVRRSQFSPFPHGSIMFSRRLFEDIGGYREACVFWEDLDLYHRLGQRGRILVLPEALCSVRFHVGSTRLAHEEARVELALTLTLRCMARFRQTGEYETELKNDGATSGINVSRARVLYSLAASRFWAGMAPGLWERLSMRDLVSWDPEVLWVFLFAIWGARDHRSLRWTMRGMVRARDALARLWMHPERPYEWRFR
jgi:glycosyltransferase involved in cell wall biosynthesis